MQDYALGDENRKQVHFLKWIFLGFLILLILGFVKKNFFSGKNQAFTSPLSDNFFSFTTPKQKDPQILIAEIKKLLEKTNGSYSLSVYDLTNNQSFGINETTIFTAASVNKIPILASLYYFANAGEINLDQQVTLQASDIQDYGTGSLRYDSPGTTYSVKTLARLMMEQSDNTASYILGREILNFEKIQKLIDSWGLTQTDMENNKTSLSDMTKILSKMYRGEVTNKALTLEMLGFMDESDFEDRLGLLLPKTVKIYHKTGDEIGLIHDIGIINPEKHAYILGIFTSDITDEKVAKETIGQISKLVYDWMQGD